MLLGMKFTRCRAPVLPFRWSVAPKSWTCHPLGVFVFLLAMLPAISVAQNGGLDSVKINGTYVQLGMRQAETLTRLSETSTLKKIGPGDDLWWVQPKEQAGMPCLEHCASVGFADGPARKSFDSFQTASSILSRTKANGTAQRLLLQSPKRAIKPRSASPTWAWFPSVDVTAHARTRGAPISTAAYGA